MKAIALLPVGLALVLAGCSGPTEGVVTAHAGLTAGSVAPDIPFQTPEGATTSLKHTRLPVTVVAFVAPSGPDCGTLEPQLADMTKQFVHLPVSVVQVSQPTASCPYGPGCVLTSGPGKRDILAICDSDRLAWRAYSEPAPGTVFLIDKNGEVAMTGSLDDLRPVIDRGIALGQEIADLHHGGWSGQY